MKVVLQNLTKIFPSRNKKVGEEVVAVNDFTFTIPDGKLVGLLGYDHDSPNYQQWLKPNKE